MIEPTGRPIPISDGLREQLQRALCAWFDAAQRDMPWRRTRDPYAIWVSEIMLQQTQVATVIPYFERFMARFPDVASLAGAPLEDVLSLWRGLGYYARARNLQRGAAWVLEQHAGRVPDTLEAILRVPGIGRYTAGAILSIAYDRPVPLLDGNVARVLCRLFGRYEDPKGTAGQKVLWGLAEALVPAERPGVFNQALMELGATVCTPVSPDCRRCPVAEGCVARALPDPAVLPVRSTAKERPVVRAVALAIRRTDGAVLFGLRPAEGLLGGMWELPTGLLEQGASIDAAARTLVEARLEGDVTLSGPVVTVAHTFTHLHLELTVVSAVYREAPLLRIEAEGPESPGSGRPGSIRATDRAERKSPDPIDAGGTGRGRKGGVDQGDTDPPGRGRKGGVDQIDTDRPRGGRKRGVDQIVVPYLAARWVEPGAIAALPMGRATSKALEALEAPARSSAQLGLFEAHTGVGRIT